jgi:ATP-dependent helicase/nuclease subunit A
LTIHQHTSEDIAAWPTPQSLRSCFTPQQERLAHLQPLDPPPSTSTATDALIAHLRATYPHQAFTTLQAARSVTDLTKHNRDIPVISASDSHPPTELDIARILPTPQCMIEDTRITAIDRGTATHSVLQYLDFAKPAKPLDLAHQVNDLVNRRLIAPAHAAAVDFGAIEWLMDSDVGHLLRTHRDILFRELPIYCAAPPQLPDGVPSSALPLDQIMVRGRLDVLIPTPVGPIIIDYKTDTVTAETLSIRAEFYRPQMDLYRDAVQNMTSQKVMKTYLVFLTPRIIWPL